MGHAQVDLARRPVAALDVLFDAHLQTVDAGRRLRQHAARLGHRQAMFIFIEDFKPDRFHSIHRQFRCCLALGAFWGAQPPIVRLPERRCNRSTASENRTVLVVGSRIANAAVLVWVGGGVRFGKMAFFRMP